MRLRLGFSAMVLGRTYRTHRQQTDVHTGARRNATLIAGSETRLLVLKQTVQRFMALERQQLQPPNL